MTEAPGPKRVGFVGVGNMGGAMAGHVLDAGFDLVVYDVRTDATRELRERGAEVALSPRVVAVDADVVDVVVMDDAQVEAVTTGDDGVLAGARPGTVLAIHSTVHPSTVRRVGEQAAPAGVAVLDAPISGGVGGARDATLCIMVGGEPDAFARARPVFEACGDLVLHLGELGAGLAAKLARNLIGYISLLGGQEGLLLAHRAGVDRDALLRICEHTGAVSPMMTSLMTQRGGHPVYADDIGPLIDLAAKDMRVTLDFAAGLGLELPAAALTLERIAPTFGVFDEEGTP